MATWMATVNPRGEGGRGDELTIKTISVTISPPRPCHTALWRRSHTLHDGCIVYVCEPNH